MKILPSLAPLFFVASLHAQTILSTDFSSATSGTYANGSAIGVGATTSMTAVNLAANMAVNVVSNSGAQTLQLTDNNSSSGGVGAYKAFQSDGFVASQGSIAGSVTFTPLSLSSGSRGYFVMMLNSGNGTVSPGSSVTAIQLYVDNSLKVRYYNGTSDTNGYVGQPTLSANTTYRFEYNMNFTNTAAETWGFSLYQVGVETALYSVSGLSTRANINPNGTAGTDYWTMVLSGGAYNAGASPDPYVQISAVSLAAVPEPSTPLLLGLGLIGGMLTYRARRKKV
ncbi:MAG: hypothetical protein BGO12_22070 [Verrucomicrobia bacterium 61-8]|nr:PEP-CTERM sorting domain-containing protein [Verrucomicrobiota bacterium]OJV23488.1 MAG: hypothetical protein BGO12_22070 [Verrucomicrobia bacterium 61-8]